MGLVDAVNPDESTIQQSLANIISRIFDSPSERSLWCNHTFGLSISLGWEANPPV